MEQEDERARRRAFFHKADGCWHARVFRFALRLLARSPVLLHTCEHTRATQRRHKHTAYTRMPDTYGERARARAVRNSINKYIYVLVSLICPECALRVYGQRTISVTRKSLRNARVSEIITAVVLAAKRGARSTQKRVSERAHIATHRIATHRIVSPLV